MNKKIIYLILFFVTALFIINSCKETNVVGIIDEESGNEENYYTLNVSKQGTGSGLIKSYPKGINCGEMCSNLFLNNTYVKLTAIGISSSTHNSSFYKWSGACTGNKTCALKMNSDKQAIAVFNIINTTIANYNLNVNVFGNGTGYVTSSPIGINCGTYGTGLLNCSKNYVNNTHVKLIAIGISNSTHNSSFYKWSGACTGYYNSFCTININSNKNVIAEFYSRKL